MGLDRTTLIPALQTGRARCAGQEPISGYRLIEPLGSGGFGEVWKCEAPGGLYKAIKFVEGGGHGSAVPGSPAARELEALQRVRDIRHPYILSTERVEVIDGVLLIVMELADKNLQDLLVEYQETGAPGLPRQELLGYLAEAAEALDVLNLQHGLQHLDVKPHNLFVVSNHIKVGDFGLVHVLPDSTAGSVEQRRGAGGTPLYAAPEILQNSLSRHSDQYSLAIVFQQLLTGTVPFWSPQAYNLVMQHLSGKPNLSALPAHDQPIVGRALAKSPDQRYPSCMDFVQALLHATGERAVPGSGLWRRPSLERATNGAAPATSDPARTALRNAALDVATRLTIPSEPKAESATTLRPAEKGTSTSLLLPGFRLLTCLGQSPLVDLWTVRDPEGRERLAHCVLNHAGAGESVLDRLRQLRHPALPTSEVFTSPNGRVVLVSDLGRKTLRDRCEECQAQGMPGIPRQQLLGYLRRAATALDQLREREGMLHLGLNPGNLLVQEERAWLGDFGLIPLFWLPAGNSAAQLNARYSAPELIDPITSETGDQYSLALIYAEMLTGIYPRAKAASSRPSSARVGRRGESAARAGRGSIKIDLDLLPVDDRGILARALADDPTERFPSCTALIDALEAATLAAAPDEQGFASLPMVVPLRSLYGEPPPPGYVPPQFAPVISQLVTNATGSVSVLSFENVRYRLHGNGVWEYHCPIQLLAGLAKLKLEGFRQHWGAKWVRDEGTLLHLRIPLGETARRTFWQLSQPRPATLEIQLQLVPTPGSPTQLREVVARLRGSGVEPEGEAHLRDLAPRVLQSLRAYLQGTPEQRVEDRWPFQQSLHLYPVLPDLELAEVMEARGRDISRGGLRCLVPQPPPTEFLYIHFLETPSMADLAILGRVVRLGEGRDGSCDLGITFSVDGPVRAEQQSLNAYA